MNHINLSNVTSNVNSFGKRYRLLEEIGHGAMGVVYRAFDLITGETVALKRLLTDLDKKPESVLDSSVDLRLLLASEFQSLASLRHPNIISVYDYGFDNRQQPYFTMELLPHTQTILQAGAGQSDQVKVDLFLQMLHALAYLHRHNIIHRDLKPSNVLVDNRRVKLLDFGLSDVGGEGGGVSGSLAYLAPEVLEDAPASRTGDLYSAGMIAYELFAGHHPFDTSNLSTLIDAILDETPDFNLTTIPPPVTHILGRLLSKIPDNRYADAGTTIGALAEAMGELLPEETSETRESFLQAAHFTGREREVTQLDHALNDTLAGRGSAWLVAGESGVGKTRLVNEIRTQALVKGFLVLRGQAVSQGGNPYQLWQEIARWLAVLAEPGALQAGVLKPLVPDIEALLDRDVPDVPELEPEAAQTRLLTLITDLVQQCTADQPLVMMLEDLQWAGVNSLAVLKWLNRVVNREQVRMLILATYRDDEHPQLPAKLPGMQLMRLGRLSDEAIATLSESILGPAGRQPQIVDFLRQETEGNTFFIVEVVRALAEEAGRLDQIGQVTLPNQVFGDRMQQVVERRLSRLPASSEPLLQLAAVAGRELDLSVLASAAPKQNITSWLTTCANMAVLNVQDQRWQFAHDKLRQGVLVKLSSDQKKRLHQEVGQAIERVYATNLLPYAAGLTYHFHQAEDTTREWRYTRLAGEQAAAQFAHTEALIYFSRAIELNPPVNYAERYALTLACEKIYDMQGKREDQEQTLITLAELANVLGEDRKRAEVALRQSNFAEITGDYPAAIAAAQNAINIAQSVDDLDKEVQGHIYWGQAQWRLGEYELAQVHLNRALSLKPKIPRLNASCLRILGLVAWHQGNFNTASDYFEQSLSICREIGDKQVEGKVLNNLGIISAQQGDYAGATDYFELSLYICRQTGDRQVEGNILNNLGIVAGYESDYGKAVGYYEQALHIKQEIDDREGQSMVLDNLGDVAKYQGEYAQATLYFEQSLRIRQAIGERKGEANNLNNLGTVADYQGDYATAKRYFEQSLQIRKDIGDKQGESEVLTYLSLLYHHLGDDDMASNYGEQARKIAQDLGDHHLLGYALTHLGHALVSLQRLTEADEVYRQATKIRRNLGEHNRALESLAGLAQVYLAQGQMDLAMIQVEAILDHLESRASEKDRGQGLHGTEQPFWILLTCYHVLNNAHDPRARDVLDYACHLLEKRAVKITKAEKRVLFLENVAAHRELIALRAALEK